MRGRRTPILNIYEPGRTRTTVAAPRQSLPQIATRRNDALADLQDAAARAGLVINETLGREYYREQAGRVDDAVLETARRFELWKADYNGKMRGREGLNALQDYASRYEELSREALREFDGADNEIFRELLERKLAERGLFAVREGAAFGAHQKEGWLASQLAAQLADFSAYAAGNPDDGEGIAFRKARLLQSWAAKNPGLDPGETAARLNGAEFTQRMEGFLASGDLPGARALLARHGALAGLSRDASLSEWLKAHNNPGSVTVDGRNFAAYASPREGLRAIMGRFASYHEKGLKTPAQIISRYAPPRENDTKAYIANVARWTGLDPNVPMDVQDPAQLAAMAGAVIKMEHSLEADPAELLAAAREFLEKGEPKAMGVIYRDKARRNFLPGFDPASFQRYGERIRLLEQKEASREDQLKAAAILEEIRQLPLERRTMEVLRVLENMPRAEAERLRPLLKAGVENRKALDHMAESFAAQDAFSRAMSDMPDASDEHLTSLAMDMANQLSDVGIREDFKRFALGELENRRQTEAARDALQVEEFLKGQAGKSPGEIRAAISRSGMSARARERAASLSWGLAREESPENAMALNLGLALKDAGLMASEAELESFAAQNNLTLGQVRQIRAYEGKAARVSVARVNGILQNLAKLGDFSGPEKIDAKAYQVLLERLKPGHEPSDQELAELLSILYISDGSWFFKKTLMDELCREQFKMDWLPEVKSWQRPKLEALLRERGIRTSERNLRLLLKLNIFRDQGFALPEQPEWEE